MNSRSMALAVLIAGACMALLGNLPFLNLVNCLLCIWVWLGGALAVILYRRFQKQAGGQTAGQGAALGALAGVVGAILGFGIYLALGALTGPMLENFLKTIVPPDQLPPQAFDTASPLAGALFWLVVDIFLYPAFGALGGLIAASMKKPASQNITTPGAPGA